MKNHAYVSLSTLLLLTTANIANAQPDFPISANGVYHTITYYGGEIIGGTETQPIYSSNTLDFKQYLSGDGNYAPDKFSLYNDYRLFQSGVNNDPEYPIPSPIFRDTYAMNGNKNNLKIRLGGEWDQPENYNRPEGYDSPFANYLGTYIGTFSQGSRTVGAPGGKIIVNGDYNDVTHHVIQNPDADLGRGVDTMVRGSYNTVKHLVAAVAPKGSVDVRGNSNIVNVYNIGSTGSEALVNGNDNNVNNDVAFGKVNTNIQGNRNTLKGYISPWLFGLHQSDHSYGVDFLNDIVQKVVGDGNKLTSQMHMSGDFQRHFDPVTQEEITGGDSLFNNITQDVNGKNNAIEAKAGDTRYVDITQTVGKNMESHNNLIKSTATKAHDSKMNITLDGDPLTPSSRTVYSGPEGRLQNYIITDQTGVDNRMDVKATGANLLTIHQGNGEGNSRQAAEDSEGYNQINLTVRNGSTAILKDSNKAVLNRLKFKRETGVNIEGAINQNGLRNSISGTIDNSFVNIEQVGNEHSIELDLKNSGRVVAKQHGDGLGNGNKMDIVQDGRINLIIAEQGAYNNQLFAEQKGSNNILISKQLTGGNIFRTLQVGNANVMALDTTRGEREITAIQKGDNNYMDVVYNGAKNQVKFEQYGNGNTIGDRERGLPLVLTSTNPRLDLSIRQGTPF